MPQFRHFISLLKKKYICKSHNISFLFVSKISIWFCMSSCSPSNQNNHKVIYSGYYHQNASENKILLCDKHNVFNALIAWCWSYGAKSTQNKAQHMIYQFDLKIHMHDSLGIFQKSYVHRVFYFFFEHKNSASITKKKDLLLEWNIEMWKWLKN